MSQPPLDAPSFQPATVRNCVQAPVRIKDVETSQEVLILTPVTRTVDSILHVDPDIPIGNGEEMSDSDLSDFSETSSSESDDDDMDAADQELRKPQPQDIHTNGGGIRSGAPMKAYWLIKDRPLCVNHHGILISYIYYAKVLQKYDYMWELTGEEVAIKSIPWRCIRRCQNRLSEDVIKEVAALEYCAKWHQAESAEICDTHILTAAMVMSNETNLYIVMPYCAGGDLCQRVAENEATRLTEDECRFWFRQILEGLQTLQLMQICHRDLSPENMIIFDNKSLVIDFGMCLRIPHSHSGMHLITPQLPCGKLPHMAPELLRKIPFDGHAVDIWAAGTILLFMLTGKRLQNPPLIDRAFDSVDLSVSYEAMDLLRKMFRLDPDDRLSLEQIKNHNWVRYEFLCQR